MHFNDGISHLTIEHFLLPMFALELCMEAKHRRNTFFKRVFCKSDRTLGFVIDFTNGGKMDVPWHKFGRLKTVITVTIFFSPQMVLCLRFFFQTFCLRIPLKFREWQTRRNGIQGMSCLLLVSQRKVVLVQRKHQLLHS